MPKQKRHSKFKKWIGKLHLWLGLASGMIVFIVAITGCIYVFHDEIKDITQPWRKVAIQNQEFIAPSVLQQKVTANFPDAAPGMVVYQGKERSAFVYSIIDNAEFNIYFNPYSAELLHSQKIDDEFFAIIENLHMYLLLPEEIGRQVVGISTIIFVVMLISGIILWWPKKRKNLKDRLKIRFTAKWRRVNYDWHNVTGLYISLLALIIAITGLSFSYEWMHESFYVIGNFGEEYPEETAMPAVEDGEPENSSIPAIDVAMEKTFALLPDAEMHFVWEQGANSPILTGSYPETLDFDHQSNFYFHPETGELLEKHLYSNKSTGLKLQEMNYGLHTGQYFGLTGKIIAFFGSLFIAGLPVSGFMIWWGRRNKKKKAKPAARRKFVAAESKV
ncbi:PepSY-associated TM helix domain-containing protein [Salegentibacter sp. F188]|uniref:PepSY-associated TM helix domain-containing protein n=1 Tax=Autumnicola patrickiae TaxID=3075591 RepID=A0ABU3DWZ3_9FLAO|nr:PepSY-associated TM helix domain-containing protein [Salegentibacter sp. F188]MDT0688232.1 PepSY-associated TM helix domain-containing protein [Salegentibacter sp. F188]